MYAILLAAFSQFSPLDVYEFGVQVCSSRLHDVRGEFASLLDENAVNIDTTPLSGGAGNMHGGGGLA